MSSSAKVVVYLRFRRSPVTENPSNAKQRRAASDPTTPRAMLADLAYDHPDLRVAIALNSSTYEGLLEWLSELDDGDVTAALAQRAAGNSGAPSVMETATPVEPAPAEPVTPSAPAPRTSRRLKISLIAAAAVIAVVGLVLGGMYAFASFAHPNGSLSAGGALTAAGSPTPATDYRFGATKTWQTKVNVVASSSEGSGEQNPGVRRYPGLWLVTWPGGGSGSGGFTNDSLLGLNPATGAVKWSLSPSSLTCATSLVSGALPCVDPYASLLSVLNPSTGKPANSSLNGTPSNAVSSYGGDIVTSYETPSDTEAVDTIERVKLDGTVVWKKSASCGESSEDGGLTFLPADELYGEAVSASEVKSNEAYLFGACLNGDINLDSGAINADASTVDDGCLQYTPFDDSDGLYTYGDACEATKYPMLIPRGSSTLTAITLDAYFNDSNDSPFPTVWSADLADADLAENDNEQNAIAYVGAHALLASAGHLYGVDTAQGPTWEQTGTFSGDNNISLLPIYPTKANTPVLALEGDHDTVVRLDPGYGAARVSVEPAKFPACPMGETPVSFTTWSKGKGATLVCQGFASTVTVFLIVDGTTYTSTAGSITPTGYYAEFGGGVSVDVGLGGWAAWVGSGNKTTLHVASSGWQTGAVHASAYPALSGDVEACPAGTHPLSLSTWDGGWLLTCGEKATTITKFIYVDGSAHGSGNSMTAQGGQSCGTTSTGHQVCVSASPAVVAFLAKGGSQTQHSVDANYVVGEGFSGAGKGTGAYGLADPEANAASEVAYLNGILQQSQAARSSVKIVVQNILKCVSVHADVQNAQAVVADRTTELQALNSAPVDAVPGGSALVSQLQAALLDSLRADKAYVSAASQVASGQCSAGKSTYNAQGPVLARGTSEKTAFTNAWNRQIASEYGTPTYTQNDI
jgi:hypothetical protein